MIRLDVEDVRVLAVLLERLGDGHLRGELDELQILDAGELLDGHRPRRRVERIAACAGAARAEPHQHLVGRMAGRGTEARCGTEQDEQGQGPPA